MNTSWSIRLKEVSGRLGRCCTRYRTGICWYPAEPGGVSSRGKKVVTREIRPFADERFICKGTFLVKRNGGKDESI